MALPVALVGKLLTDRRFRALLVTVGPLAAQEAKRLAESGRFRQLAIRHAETLRDGRFSRENVVGHEVWVVWAGDRPVMSYPPAADDLRSALRHADPDRRRRPGDLPVRKARRTVAGAGRSAAGRVPRRRGRPR
jgi:hypothetical protein